MKTKLFAAALLARCLTSGASFGHSITQSKEGPGLPSYLPLVGQFLAGLDVEVQQLSVDLRADRRVRSCTIYDLKWGRESKGEAGNPPLSLAATRLHRVGRDFASATQSGTEAPMRVVS